MNDVNMSDCLQNILSSVLKILLIKIRSYHKGIRMKTIASMPLKLQDCTPWATQLKALVATYVLLEVVCFDQLIKQGKPQ